jgi:NADP-dependent 3-hydroxy acid dehydrogenase YdfG
MKNGIANKVVAITGASSGIGRVTAELLAAQGAKVILGARRAERLKEIADQINKNGGEAVYAEIDVTRQSDLASLAGLALERFGRLNVMINNAGISQLQKMEDLDVAGWEEMIDVNVKGTLYGIAAAYPFLKPGLRPYH